MNFWIIWLFSVSDFESKNQTNHQTVSRHDDFVDNADDIPVSHDLQMNGVRQQLEVTISELMKTVDPSDHSSQGGNLNSEQIAMVDRLTADIESRIQKASTQM